MSDFELIVVDDSSSDGTPELLNSIPDSRVRIIRNVRRLGIAEARNRGLAECRARYIAMLDHDDLSDARRLGLQMAYLESHPDVLLVGSAVQELSQRGLISEDQPTRTSPPLMRLLLYLDNPLAWSSVMLRAEGLRRLDPPPLRARFEPADDFDLYHRLLEHGQVARLDIPLTIYRWHASNASYQTGARMNDRAADVLARAYAPWFGADAKTAAALVVQHSSDRVPVPDMARMRRLRQVVLRVAEGVAATRPADRAAIADGVQLVLWRLTRAAVRSGRLSLFRPPAPWFDATASLAVGAVRAGLRWRRANGTGINNE